MVDLSKKISKYFVLKDCLFSSSAERRPDLQELQYNPSDEIVQNLILVCTNCLDRIYEYLHSQGYGMSITSGYRSEKLNKLIGGSSTSDHVKGRAIDFQIFLLDRKTTLNLNIGYKLLYKWITQNLEYDQLIWEYGNVDCPSWLHISYRHGGNRKMNLRIGSYTGNKYENFSIEKLKI
jgi:hypothetical protein